MSDPLPSYTSPPYTPPSTYTIGPYRTAPLLTPSQLKGHLALLGAFSELKTTVEDLKNPTDSESKRFPFLPAKKERKWTWFVGLAVERYSSSL